MLCFGLDGSTEFFFSLQLEYPEFTFLLFCSSHHLRGDRVRNSSYYQWYLSICEM